MAFDKYDSHVLLNVNKVLVSIDNYGHRNNTNNSLGKVDAFCS